MSLGSVMNILVRFSVHVIFPTAIGTCIYVGWRSTDLLVFRWIEFCGLTGLVIRPTLALPDWLLYSLPDGCWVYSATSWMMLIWNRLVPWTWVAVLLAVSAEYGQLFGLVQGTYQSLDVFFYLAGFICAVILNAKKTSLVDDSNPHHGILGIRQH